MMNMIRDPILSAFSYLFLVWFIVLVVVQIYFCARKRKETARKVLYAGAAFAAAVSAGLTVYTVYASSAPFVFTGFLISWLFNLFLWIAPVLIAFVIYVIYFRRNIN